MTAQTFSKALTIEIDYDHLLDFVNLAVGLFAPLDRFMNHADFDSAVHSLTLPSGDTFPIPILLPVTVTEKLLSKHDHLALTYQQKPVGFVRIEEVFKTKPEDFHIVFKTKDASHPGLKKHLNESELIVGGKVFLLNDSIIDELDVLTPAKSKAIFAQKGWRSVVGFQTRNPIHRGHEHLQRVGLELCDGLFINPLVGWKKSGDLGEEAIDAAYHAMITHYYPKDRVYYYGLRTTMRYAGPKEAVFHALIRRNLGCTHFIVGRDHAGVGDFYSLEESVRLAQEHEKGLGISIIAFDQIHFCKTCGHTASQKTCKHNSDSIERISGTMSREYLRKLQKPPEYLMRKEIAEAILALDQPFIE